MNGSIGGVPSGSRSNFVNRLKEFWSRLTEGLQLQQLWSDFKSDVRSSYGFYSTEIGAKEIQASTRFKRHLRIAQALAWSILMKLTPARRVLLLLSVVLLFFPSAEWKGEHFETRTQDFRLVGGLGLLLLLLLEVADRVVMKRDLEIARDIQRWLMPGHPPKFPGVDFAFASRPANTVAGDYYDVLVRPRLEVANQDGPVLLVVADVVGKSIPAAILMATFQASLRTLAGTAGSLSEVCRGLNRYACQFSGGGLRFTTAFLAEFDRQDGCLEYVNAGHNPPLLRRSADSLEKLEADDVPFGIRQDVEYAARSINLSPGDLLVIYTDGLIEAVDQQDREFGEERLAHLIQSCPEGASQGILEHIMTALECHVGSARQNDDVTLMVLKVTG